MKSTDNSKRVTDDLIERLRGLHPVGPGPVSHPAALRIAKVQAEFVAALAGAVMSARQLLQLAQEIEIRNDPALPVPSASQFNEHTGKWQILLSTNESPGRQNLELLREFKRIIDSRDAGILYAPDSPIGDVEQLLAADYFARVALMPESDVHRAAEHGVKSLQTLAAMFHIPVSAARKRVSDLELTDRIHTD